MKLGGDSETFWILEETLSVFFALLRESDGESFASSFAVGRCNQGRVDLDDRPSTVEIVLRNGIGELASGSSDQSLKRSSNTHMRDGSKELRSHSSFLDRVLLFHKLIWWTNSRVVLAECVPEHLRVPHNREQ
jgi:hypothetical protein